MTVVKGHVNGETSNNLPAPETNSTIFNMNPNNNQVTPANLYHSKIFHVTMMILNINEMIV